MNKIVALKDGGREWGKKYWTPSKWKKNNWMRYEFIKHGISISEKHKFIFFGIAKNAGTSIRSVLKEHISDLVVHPYLQFPIYSNAYDSFFKFAFIRNPWSRFVSAYNYFIEHKLISDVSFKEFVLNKAWDDDGEPLNEHWLQQYYYIQDKNKCWVDFIGRYENIEDDFKNVLQRIGLNSDIELPHRNVSESCSYKEYYDDETKEFIGEKYKRDIELFSYKFKKGE